MKVTKVVLTGGPCAGKSSILKSVKTRFVEQGYAVYALPEAATLFSEAGADFLTKDAHLSYVTELSKLKYQLAMENCMNEIAQNCGKPVIIVCDRGTMDTSAYISQEVWQSIKKELNVSDELLRDQRYDAVIHLCTAAKGAEEFYSLSNNACRSESIVFARVIDDNLIRAWQNHPRYFVVNAEVYFEDKVQKVMDIIDRLCEENYGKESNGK